MEFPQVSRSALYAIVSENFKKLCACWVPKLLTEDHEKQRLDSALTFLTRYDEEGYDVSSQIVTGDETWVSNITPESKQQRLEW